MKKPRVTSSSPAQHDPTLEVDYSKQPISKVEWVDPSTLHANDYNPNRVFTPEMELLKLSILEDGWTAPITVTPEGEVIDGFHRWTLGSRDPEIRALTAGLVPVVRTKPKDRAAQMAATVRHNRARGQHGVLKMASIVRAMMSEGRTEAEVADALGMEPEEVERLADERGSPDQVGKDSFGRGWVPDPHAKSGA